MDSASASTLYGKSYEPHTSQYIACSLYSAATIWYNTLMLSDSLYDFISGRKHFIWYVKDYRALSEESIVEATLNYGDWDDVQKLIRILGIERMAAIFRKQMVTGRQRGNYYPDVVNYFNLYFDKYASHA